MLENIGGFPTYLTSQGNGSPILFIHGNPDSSDIWSSTISGLSQKFRCLAFDLPGFGRSDKAWNFPYGLEQQADFCYQLLENIGEHRSVDLVVHDLGGCWGLPFLVKYPHRVRRVIIMNTLFFSDYTWHTWARIWRTPLLGEISMLAMNFPLFARELRRGSKGYPIEDIRQAYQFTSLRMRLAVLKHYRSHSPAVFQDWEDRMASVLKDKPTLVIWGDQDPYIPSTYAERFGGRCIHLPETGHWTMVERPLEVTQFIEEFLV